MFSIIIVIGILSIGFVSAGFVDWIKDLFGIDNNGLGGELRTLSGKNNCIDSDGGKDYYVEGEVYYTNLSGDEIFLQDYCKRPSMLDEYYCENGIGKVISKSCPIEGEICKGGACILYNSTGTEPEECMDSDGGKDYYIRGYINYTNPSGKRAFREDFCGNIRDLMEYSCLSGEWDKHGEVRTFICPEGYICEEGACILGEIGEVACYKDEDCGPLHKLAQGYCSNNQIFYNWTHNVCYYDGLPNSYCKSTDTTYKVNCTYGCEENSNDCILKDCIDTDGGRNYFKKGTCIGSYNTLEDKSYMHEITGGSVWESYCHNVSAAPYEDYYHNGEICMRTSFICVNGIKDGACIGNESQNPQFSKFCGDGICAQGYKMMMSFDSRWRLRSGELILLYSINSTHVQFNITDNEENSWITPMIQKETFYELMENTTIYISLDFEGYGTQDPDTFFLSVGETEVSCPQDCTIQIPTTETSPNQTITSSPSSGSPSSGGSGTVISNIPNSFVEIITDLATNQEEKQTKKVIVNLQESTITGKDIGAVSQVQLTESEGKIYALHSGGGSGESYSVEIKLSPDDVVEKIKQKIKTENIKEVKIIEYKEIIVYEVDSEKSVKVIALIPANMNILTKINIESGDIVDVKRPWWSVVATED